MYIHTRAPMSNVRSKMAERQRVWMAQRQAHIDQSDATAQVMSEMSSSSSSSSSSSLAVGGGHNHPYHPHQQSGSSAAAPGKDRVLNVLTERITSRLRDELAKELRSESALLAGEQNDLASKMDDYLEGELQTHVCQICYEVMVPAEGRAPTLLFPCGHTFCRICVEAHRRKNSRGGTAKCPLCRKAIRNIAENQPLKQLIEAFVKQRSALEKGDVPFLDDVFVAKKKAGGGGRGGGGGEEEEEATAPESPSRQLDAEAKRKDGRRYMAQYRGLEMRHRILKNEVEDAETAVSTAREKRDACAIARAHLQCERESCEARMKTLKEEMDLIDRHLADQAAKESDLDAEIKEETERLDLINVTAAGLAAEMDKSKMLAESLLAADSK